MPLQEMVLLSLGLVEEGQLLADLDELFARTQAELVAYCKRYGEDARGAKAVVELKITLMASKQKDDATVLVKSCLKATRPGRPDTISATIRDSDPTTGEVGLFVRSTGSDEMSPLQGKLPLGADKED